MANPKTEPGWVRVPGRKFENLKTGEVVTRHAYDKMRGIEHHKKAKKNRAIEGRAEQLLKPARGRSSARRVIGEAREKEKARRLVIREELENNKRRNKLIKSAMRKKYRKYSKLNIKAGSPSRIYSVPLDLEAIQEVVLMGRKSNKIFGYTVGVDAIMESSDRGVDKGAWTVIPGRYIEDDFTESDFEELLESFGPQADDSKKSAVVYGAHVRLMKKTEVVDAENSKIQLAKEKAILRGQRKG
jgi:hypothetical protein